MLPPLPCDGLKATSVLPSRANAVRPVSISGRSYLVWTSAFFSVFSGVFAVGFLMEILETGISVDAIGHAILSTGAALVAAMALLRLFANCFRRRFLRSATYANVRLLLHSAEAEPHVEPSVRAVRALKLGTLIFSLGLIGFVIKCLFALNSSVP